MAEAAAFADTIFCLPILNVVIGERKGFLKYTTKPSNLTGELVRRKISKLKCRQWTNGQLYNSSIKGEGEKKKKKRSCFYICFFFFINAAQCRVWIFFPQKWSKLFKKNFFSFFRRIIIQRFFFFLRNWTSSLCCIFFFFFLHFFRLVHSLAFFQIYYLSGQVGRSTMWI